MRYRPPLSSRPVVFGDNLREQHVAFLDHHAALEEAHWHSFLRGLNRHVEVSADLPGVLLVIAHARKRPAG